MRGGIKRQSPKARDKASPAEEVGPAAPGSFTYPFKPVAAAGQNCATARPCSWDSTKKNSWQTNRAAAMVQKVLRQAP